MTFGQHFIKLKAKFGYELLTECAWISLLGYCTEFVYRQYAAELGKIEQDRAVNRASRGAAFFIFFSLSRRFSRPAAHVRLKGK